MTRNILLTTLDAALNDRSLRYYAAPKEYGCDYCEAVQSAEASTKYILARFPIDEILVVGEDEAAADHSKMKPLRLKDAGDLYAANPETLSAFDLYRRRIAQYIDELKPEQQAYDALLPEEERTKITDFIRSFQEKHSKQETKRLNRFFDELACDRSLYAQFRDALFTAFPESRKDAGRYLKWVNNYLYMQLKPSAKLEILPVNEKIGVCYIPAGAMEKRETWVESIPGIDRKSPDGKDEINLYLSMGTGSAVDGYLLLNLLNILIVTPGSNVHLKKIYEVSEAAENLAGMIEDGTVVSQASNLVAAAHAFLNYSKTDMLVEFWENCGEQNERISSMIYAARHVDVGMSMCNMSEVQEGIRRLRELFRDERPWTEDGKYGLLFGIIAGSIRADYGALLEGEDTISFIELIKWAYRHQLYQQVLTLIEAHAPAHLVNTGIFFYCDNEEQAERITKLLGQQRLELKPYEYYKMDDIEHYFIKNYDRSSVKLKGSKNEDRDHAYAALRAESLAGGDPEKIRGYTACSKAETVQNVLYAYYHLGTIRNKVSHADADAMAESRLIVSESDVSSAMLLMREGIEYFIMSYGKALEEVQGKNPGIVHITPDAVRGAAERMKREQFRTDRHASGRRPAFDSSACS